MSNAPNEEPDYAQRMVSAQRLVAAPAETIFELLRDPSKHPLFDGSGSVVASTDESKRMVLGSTFGMKMNLWVPYRIRNRVVEFRENRLIAWAHYPGHRWRFELEPVQTEDGLPGTLVRETFDWSTAHFAWALELLKFPKRNAPSLALTLERLAGLVEVAS